MNDRRYNKREQYCQITGEITGLLEQVELIRSKNGLKKVIFAFEPTGNYHKPLGSYLTGNGFNVVLVSGKSVKNNRETLDERWDKHDLKDAANVADLASRGRCQYYDQPSEKIIEMRDLLSLRRRLKKDEHIIRVRIRNAILAKYFPELDKFFGNVISLSQIRSIDILMSPSCLTYFISCNILLIVVIRSGIFSLHVLNTASAFTSA